MGRHRAAHRKNSYIKNVCLVNADSVPCMERFDLDRDSHWPGQGKKHAASLQTRCNEELADIDTQRRILCEALSMRQWIDKGGANDVLEPDEIRRFLRQPPDSE